MLNREDRECCEGGYEEYLADSKHIPDRNASKILVSNVCLDGEEL